MRRLPDPVQKINAWVLGSDLHKRITVSVVLDRRGHFVDQVQIPSRPAALRALYEEIIGRKRAHVVFEGGGSSGWAFDTSAKWVPRWPVATRMRRMTPETGSSTTSAHSATCGSDTDW